MRRLVLVRHGESVWNAEGRVQGQSCAGLSPRGHGQAAATAAALAAEHPDARLVTSDLRRTCETIAPLEVALGRTARRDERLRERSFGAWERRLRDEVVREDTDRWQRWLDGSDVIAEVGGESAEALADRVVPVLTELLDATPPHATTVAVTHGGPIWQGLHRLLGMVPGVVAGVDNAALFELIGLDDGTVLLDRWNSVGHLPLPLRGGWSPRRADADGTAAGPQADAPPVGR